VEDLVSFREIIKRKVSKSTYNSWVEAGIGSGSVDIIKSIFRLNPSGERVNSVQFSKACRASSVDTSIVTALLKEGGVDVNTGTENTHPLICAIKNGTTAVIGVVLDAGAEISLTLNQPTPSTTSSPGTLGRPLTSTMQAAFHRRDKDVLDYLMDRGATMPPTELWPSHEKTGEMIREVAIKHGITRV
jgi:hypothetical protein